MAEYENDFLPTLGPHVTCRKEREEAVSREVQERKMEKNEKMIKIAACSRGF